MNFCFEAFDDDYGTGDVAGNNIFDITKASNSDTQQLLDGSSYWRTHRNTHSEIVQMTPYEYFEACARDCFSEPVSKLIASRRRDAEILADLKRIILEKKKQFPIAYIDYADFYKPSQEGLHRMMVAGDLFGWNTKFPVQIIRWIDPEKAEQEKRSKYKHKIENYIEYALHDAVRYRFDNLSEFKEQLQWSIERELKYVSEFEGKKFKLEVNPIDDDEMQILVDNTYEVIFDPSILRIDNIEPSEDSIDDWLMNYIDTSELEALSEEFSYIERALSASSFLKKLEDKFGPDYSSKRISDQVCAYIKENYRDCQILDLGITVWKYKDYELHKLSSGDHCVIKYADKLFDYTSDVYDDPDISKTHEQPRILTYNPGLSKAFKIDIYNDKNYIISVF